MLPEQKRQPEKSSLAEVYEKLGLDNDCRQQDTRALRGGDPGGRPARRALDDEAYAKIMGKCSGLGCSVHDHLKMLVETDIANAKEAKPANTTQATTRKEDAYEEEVGKRIEHLTEILSGSKA